MAQPIDLNRRVFCVISGASRGIGKAVAVETARQVGTGSKFVLLARDSAQLNETKAAVEALDREAVAVSIDLESPAESQLVEILKTSCVQDYDVALIVHNVGTLGNNRQWMVDAKDPGEWMSYFRINLISVILLNNLFLDVCSHISTKVVANVTSLCAVEPMKSLGYYCSGKAAREMFFRVLALENPTLTVLNYSPGMVETNMAADLRTHSVDDELKSYTQSHFEKGAHLTPQQTSLKFLDIIRRGGFAPGAHVDYHDASIDNAPGIRD